MGGRVKELQRRESTGGRWDSSRARAGRWRSFLCFLFLGGADWVKNGVKDGGGRKQQAGRRSSREAGAGKGGEEDEFFFFLIVLALWFLLHVLFLLFASSFTLLFAGYLYFLISAAQIFL